MMQALYGLVAYALSGAVARLLIGGGMTLVVATGLSGAVETLLSSAASSFGAMPSAVTQLALLSGVGEALSILGGAILTRMTIITAANVLGVKRTQ